MEAAKRPREIQSSKYQQHSPSAEIGKQTVTIFYITSEPERKQERASRLYGDPATTR